MSDSVSQYLKEKVFARKCEGNFRSLFLSGNNVDFFSNDYLGIATQNSLKTLIEKKINEFDKSPRLYGATGSRLLSGNTSFAEELEHVLAQMHQSEAALLFPSGYMANLGVLSSIPYKNATIIYDELVHASMHDGIRMSKAKSLS
ncbi:MAG: aminotransferase class I/II-fold pyridoxal phosphate-dependent enzyme, partial [Chitinophagales bacterium]|nr:aminotransferase class I/II-fold pyridoxal phosphate-dependent enzyme [Chitinophagales bacterium]